MEWRLAHGYFSKLRNGLSMAERVPVESYAREEALKKAHTMRRNEVKKLRDRISELEGIDFNSTAKPLKK